MRINSVSNHNSSNRQNFGAVFAYNQPLRNMTSGIKYSYETERDNENEILSKLIYHVRRKLPEDRIEIRNCCVKYNDDGTREMCYSLRNFDNAKIAIISTTYQNDKRQRLISFLKEFIKLKESSFFTKNLWKELGNENTLIQYMTGRDCIINNYMFKPSLDKDL